jgi:hypothetical protein
VAIKTTLGLLTLLACSAAAADERRGAWSVDRAPAAMVYLEFPIAAKGHGPALGFRVQRPGSIGFQALRADLARSSTTVLDIRLNARKERDGVETEGLALLGPGKITGIVVGAVVAVAVISDDDDGGGGGY